MSGFKRAALKVARYVSGSDCARRLDPAQGLIVAALHKCCGYCKAASRPLSPQRGQAGLICYDRAMTGTFFASYDSSRMDECLALFDANCPAYFAPNERGDYVAFLRDVGPAYTLVLRDSALVAAFGLLPAHSQRFQLSWIMVDPSSHGSGVGRAMMAKAAARAVELGVDVVNIAASHRSAPFFARFGARYLSRTENGWGVGMHRVDMEWPIGH